MLIVIFFVVDIPLGYLLFVSTNLVNTVKVSFIVQLIYLVIYEFWKLSDAPRFYYGGLNTLESKQTEMYLIHFQFLYSIIQIIVIHVMAIKNCEVLNLCVEMVHGYENRKV